MIPLLFGTVLAVPREFTAPGNGVSHRLTPVDRAILYLDGQEQTNVLAEQFGVRRASITQAVARLRDERGIRRPQSGGVPAKPTSLQQSADAHRFDCTAVPEERRGAGPFGPVKAPTPAQLIAKLRDERAARSQP